MREWLRKNYLPAIYVLSMAALMLGYVRYDTYQLDGDAVSYMDIASSIQHGRWHEIVNGLWNPGYPALLALGKLVSHANRFQELHVFYWVNYCIFLFCIVCTTFFVDSLLVIRSHLAAEKVVLQPLTNKRYGWLLSPSLLYAVAYSAVFLSWQQEYSPGKIRVDGLFATLLLLAFGCLLQMVLLHSQTAAFILGLTLGLAYLVKSPGFVLALIVFCFLGAYFVFQSSLRRDIRNLFLGILGFIVVAGPYITALSVQKSKFDFGDSGRLNYIWIVGGSGPQRLLNDQSSRLGSASLHLEHPALEVLHNPDVYKFTHFPNATYGSWLDPSYFNDGSRIHFLFGRQMQVFIQQLRRVFAFIVAHAMPITLLIVLWMYGIRFVQHRGVLQILLLLSAVAASYVFLLCAVHFEARYVSGLFWIVWITMLGLAVVDDTNRPSRLTAIGAAQFLILSIGILSLQSIVLMRERVIMARSNLGLDMTPEFDVAEALSRDGIAPGSQVACFRACDADSYWARLDSLHVTAEIFDRRYMQNGESSNQIWQALPNKPEILQALRGVGEKGIVGIFDDPPGDGWQWLAGHYYWLPTMSAVSVSKSMAQPSQGRNP